MARVKQFADDLGISKNKAQALINKGRSRKDGGSQILESVMADKTKDKTKDKKKKKKKSEKLQPDIGRRAPPMYERDLEIRPRTAEYRKEMDNIDFSGMKPDVYSKGGSKVTMKKPIYAEKGKVVKLKKGDNSKAVSAQFKNLVNASTSGRISPAEAERKIRKLVLNKKAGGATDFGMLSVKAGIDKNPSPTKADRIAGATMKEKTVNKAKGGGIAIQGLGFKGVR